MTAGLTRSEAWLRDYESKRMEKQCAPIDERIQPYVRLVLPWPPSVNHSGADAMRGGRKTKAWHAFMDTVARIVVELGSPRMPPEARLELVIDAVPPDARPRDLDNTLKVTQDALQVAGVYANDCLVDDLRIRRMPCLIPGNGSIVVMVRTLAGRK